MKFDISVHNNKSVEGLYRANRAFSRRYVQLQNGRYSTVVIGDSTARQGSQGTYDWRDSILTLTESETGKQQIYKRAPQGFASTTELSSNDRTDHPSVPARVEWREYLFQVAGANGPTSGTDTETNKAFAELKRVHDRG